MTSPAALCHALGPSRAPPARPPLQPGSASAEDHPPSHRPRPARGERRIEAHRHDGSGRGSSVRGSCPSPGPRACLRASPLWKNNLHSAGPAAPCSVPGGRGKLEALGGGQKSACGSALTWYARTRYADEGASKRHPKRPSKRPTRAPEAGCKSFVRNELRQNELLGRYCELRPEIQVASCQQVAPSARPKRRFSPGVGVRAFTARAARIHRARRAHLP